MNKLEMAHDWAMNVIKAGYCNETELLIKEAWTYADLMQAEADKREDKRIPDIFKKDKDGNCLHTHTTFGGGECFDCGVNLKEGWQPDWSKSPCWAGWWAMNRNGQGVWHNRKPSHEQSMSEWVVDFSAGSDFSYRNSIDFGYVGSWTDSLRKRPE